jgi:hypothetical protein
VLFALVWGLCAGLAECFVFTSVPKKPAAAPIVYVAAAGGAFVGWPVIGVLLLFEEPKPK